VLQYQNMNSQFSPVLTKTSNKSMRARSDQKSVQAYIGLLVLAVVSIVVVSVSIFSLWGQNKTRNDILEIRAQIDSLRSRQNRPSSERDGQRRSKELDEVIDSESRIILKTPVSVFFCS